ncbi:hypothetical protein Tco_0953006 [Tanacetum coccineum]|uniref:Uncharacterized protein n=1 Tax=Tanacetum coccineum TaxID=301880 RepID=A0ABQ5DYP5_9ASTR
MKTMMGKGLKDHNLGFNSTSAHGNAAGMNPNKVAHGVVDVSQQIGNLVSSSLRVSYVPGTANVLDLPSEKHTEVMETIWAMWDAFLIENPNVTSGYSSDLGKSDVVIGESLTSVEGVAAFFRVPLKIQVDYENFAKGIERGTYDFWLKLTRKQRKAILKTAHDGWNALLELESAGLGISVITVPSVVSPYEPIVKTIDTHENSDPIVQSVDINNMPTSYARAAGANNKDQPKVMSNFCHLVAYHVFNGVDISIPYKVVEKVKLHDVPLKVFEEDGISLIASFIGKLVMLDSYTSSMCNDSWGRSSFAWCLIEINSKADPVEAVTIGIPLLTGEDFTKETIHVVSPPIVVTPNVVNTFNVVTPTIENDGFQAVGKKKKKKGKTKTSNNGQFVGPSIHQNFRYEPKASTSAPKKVANMGNVSISSSLLKNKEEEEVENVYDEMANIFNTKIGGRSSFTAVVG